MTYNKSKVLIKTLLAESRLINHMPKVLDLKPCVRASGVRSLSNRSKVSMIHGFFRRQSFLMVVAKQFGDKVNGVIRDKMLILRTNELVPRLFRVASQNAVKVRIQLEIIRIQVVEELFCAEHFGNLHQLVVVIMAVKERFLSEDHSSKHASQAPHVERIVVLLQVHQQFRSLEVSRSNSDIVLSSRVVKLCESPVNEAQLPLLVVNHDVVWLHVPMHDPVGMTIIESLEELKDVEANVEIGKRRVEDFEVGVVDMLKDERWRFGLWIADDVEKLNNVCSAAHVLENFDLALNLLFLDRLEDLDDAFRVVDDVDSFKDLRVLAAANLANDFVLFLVAPVDSQCLVVPILARTVDIHVGVNSAFRQQ